MVDSKTGKGLWGKKGSGLKIKGYVVKYYKVNDYYVLAFFKEGITAISIDGIDFRRQDVNINVLDPKKGEFLFKKDVKMTGTPDNIELIPAGLLVHTSKEANIIDLKTGNLKFKKSIKAAVEKNEPREFPYLSLDDEYLIFSSKDDLLYSIDKQSGKLNTICKEDILFGGDEYPHTIEIRENDILIYSAQNIMRIDRNKDVIYEEFYPGVGARGIFLALKILKTIRTVNNSINAVEISIAFEDLFETRSKSAVSKDYVFMLINLGNRRVNGRLIDAIGLIRVDKNTGKPIDLIDLGADKEPDYEVDPIEERILYIMPDRLNINCYQY